MAITGMNKNGEMVDQVESSRSPLAETHEELKEREDGEFNVANEAIGTGNIPPGYFYSPKFIGTLVGVTLMNISLYVGYVLPVSDEALGMIRTRL